MNSKVKAETSETYSALGRLLALSLGAQRVPRSVSSTAGGTWGESLTGPDAFCNGGVKAVVALQTRDSAVSARLRQGQSR